MQTVAPETAPPAPPRRTPRTTGSWLEPRPTRSVSLPRTSAPASRSDAAVPPDPGQELSTSIVRRTQGDPLPAASLAQITTSLGPLVQPGSFWVSMEND